jgi:uncharacterized membrane protein
MAGAASKLVIFLIIMAFIVIGGIFLQIFLAKRENKWFGLILPFISFCYASLMVFGVVLYDGMTMWETFCLFALLFLMTNIPTVILLAVYFGCRGKFRRKRELDRMNAQDL